MERPYQYIHIERLGPAIGVRLKRRKFDDETVDRMGAELARLLDEEGCRHLILNLGPDEPECLYSVFLAKLVSLKKRLDAVGGTFALANLSPLAHDIFVAAGIEKFFTIFPDQASALQAVAEHGGSA